jgi:hypothetical protein
MVPVEFFVPKVSIENAENFYAKLAAGCHRLVPASDRRVYEIEWDHDGEDWTATVGEHLRGKKIRTVRPKGRPFVSTETTPLSDPATVLAIFAGIPYMVVTDARPLGAVLSSWANPFMAGEPSIVRCFGLAQ